MNERDDLLEWMAVWQTKESIPRDLRDELQRRVLRSQRRWRIAAVIEIVIGTIGVLVTALSPGTPRVSLSDSRCRRWRSSSSAPA